MKEKQKNDTRKQKKKNTENRWQTDTRNKRKKNKKENQIKWNRK